MTKKAAAPARASEVAPVVLTPEAALAELSKQAVASAMLKEERLVLGLDTASGPDESAQLLLLNVRGCSACGGNHNGVIELPLPAPAAEDIRHTHYFNCPTTGQRVTIKHKEA